MGENADQTAAGNAEEIKKKQDADAPRHDTGVEQAVGRAQQAEARTEQAEARTEQAEARIEQAEARTEQAEARTEQAEARTEQAEARTEQAVGRTEQAEARSEQVEARSEQAETRSEQVIRASELSYRRLFEGAQDGILILDVDTGRISDVNPFLVELLGFSHGEMLGKTVGELSPFKDIESNKAMLERLQQHGYVRYEYLPLETKDNRHIAVEFVSNVYQAGDKKVIQCNIRDITERKRSQDQILQTERGVGATCHRPYCAIGVVQLFHLSRFARSVAPYRRLHGTAERRRRAVPFRTMSPAHKYYFPVGKTDERFD